jgi:hypothetical protein
MMMLCCLQSHHLAIKKKWIAIQTLSLRWSVKREVTGVSYLLTITESDPLNSDTFLEEYNHLGEEFEQVKEDDGTCYFVAKLTTPPTEEEFQTASRRIFGQPLQRRTKSAQEIAVKGWKELESFTGVF